MTYLRQIGILAALCSLPLFCVAQTVTLPAEKPEAKKTSEPMKADAKAEKMAPKPVYRRLTERSRLDARECLAYPTNHEVIVCAEKFL